LLSRNKKVFDNLLRISCSRNRRFVTIKNKGGGWKKRHTRLFLPLG